MTTKQKEKRTIGYKILVNDCSPGWGAASKVRWSLPTRRKAGAFKVLRPRRTPWGGRPYAQSDLAICEYGLHFFLTLRAVTTHLTQTYPHEKVSIFLCEAIGTLDHDWQGKACARRLRLLTRLIHFPKIKGQWGHSRGWAPKQLETFQEEAKKARELYKLGTWG